MKTRMQLYTIEEKYSTSFGRIVMIKKLKNMSVLSVFSKTKAIQAICKFLMKKLQKCYFCYFLNVYYLKMRCLIIYHNLTNCISLYA